MSKLLITKHDTCVESEESDDGALTSEESMPKSLIRGKINDENSCEKELKWENVSGVEDTDESRDLKHDKGSKEKEKTTRIRDPVVSQSNNNEQAVLLGLVDTSSSKSLGKREAINEAKDEAMKNDKKAKCKTKDGVLETRESASIANMKLRQHTKRR